MIPSPFTVEKVRRETKDTFTLEMIQAGKGASAAFSP